MHFNGKYRLAFVVLTGVILTACGADGDNPGTEFAPQMYHSIPYEPLTQITDVESGGWLGSDNDEQGEFYNSNPYNLHGMTMREPAPNTVKRTENGMMPVTIPADTLGSAYWLDYAAANLENPLDTEDEAVLEQGRMLYARFCVPCHGGAGAGDGPVGQVMKGVPSFKVGRYAELTEGHIFHVITYGRGRMMPYDSQLDVEERWQIVEYVKQLQN